MTPNPLLKKMGFSDTDRLVIFHTDDIGMCQASLKAFEDLWQAGTISSGAVMVPCPWFPAVAQFCRRNPDVDMGVHATLNCEWDSFRWGPISTRAAESGLLDAEGYLHQSPRAVFEHALPEAVSAELTAQVETALRAGINISHIDSHMGTILHPKFIQSYLQSGHTYRVPNMIPRMNADSVLSMMGYEASVIEQYRPLLQQMEQAGVPMIDHIAALPLEHGDGHIQIAKKLLSEVPAGITHFLFHPSIDTPELRAIAPDWRGRVANYQAFMSAEIKEFIHSAGIQVIGYRHIQQAM